MAKLVSYELQTYNGGQWKIDSVFDDRDLALHEARRLAESRRHSAVRVVQEEFDQSTNDLSNRIVYRSSSVDESNEAAREQRIKNARAAATARTALADIKLSATAPKAEQKKGGMLISALLTGGGILLLGIAAMLALRHYMAGI